MSAHTLHLDLETFSGEPIAKAGLYKYVESNDFEILLFSYSYDGGPVICVDFKNGEVLPQDITAALTSPYCLKYAHNAAFEWACLSKYFGFALPAEQWRCSMLHCLYAGYPAKLEAAGKALGLAEDKQKMQAGKSLIRYFCCPCAPTAANGGRKRNFPQHYPERWELFKAYNMQDVVTEMEIEQKLAAVPVPYEIQKEWETDLIINSRGVAVDMPLVEGAANIGRAEKEKLMQEAGQLSGLSNPNSVTQLKKWLEKETDEEIESLDKETIAGMLSEGVGSERVRRMLELRQDLGKTSVKKYNAIEAAACADNRVRGLLQFYGANRTGRWAGRLVQVQNLPRTHLSSLELARELTAQGKADALKLIYGSLPDTLSQLIRSAFIAAPGKIFIDADFSAIEARVIAWLAGEQWRLNVFRTHGKIYEASASQMFGVPIEKIKKGNPEYALRQKGKVAELALGYGGSTGALKKMGALKMGIPESDLPEIVSRWRKSNVRITDLWAQIENAAIQSAGSGYSTAVKGLIFKHGFNRAAGTDYLSVVLPSGRELFYISPKLGRNRWDKPSLTYMGVNQTSGKWERIETYGGKLTENIVQALSRDCLAHAIQNLTAAGFEIVFHIHDEVVIECPDSSATLDDVIRIMSMPVKWAPDLPLAADGWMGKFFKKE